MMIEQTKNYVEEMYTVENGYKHNAKVGFKNWMFIAATKILLSRCVLYKEASS